MHALAMSIAWEQVAHWRTFMTASDAGAVIGVRKDRADWATIARRLAILWIELQANELRRAA